MSLWTCNWEMVMNRSGAGFVPGVIFMDRYLVVRENGTPTEGSECYDLHIYSLWTK